MPDAAAFHRQPARRIALLALVGLSSSLIAQPAAAQPPVWMIVAAIDSDRDGAVSRQEVLDFRLARFDRFDRNGDGVIDAGDADPRGEGPTHPDAIAEFVAAVDADGDGRITRAELRDGPTPGFDKADLNQDGFLTDAEVSAFAATRR